MLASNPPESRELTGQSYGVGPPHAARTGLGRAGEAKGGENQDRVDRARSTWEGVGE